MTAGNDERDRTTFGRSISDRDGDKARETRTGKNVGYMATAGSNEVGRRDILGHVEGVENRTSDRCRTTNITESMATRSTWLRNSAWKPYVS